MTRQNGTERRRAFLCAAALALFAVSLLSGLVSDGVFLAAWRGAEIFCDLDGDGANERIVVENRSARMEHAGRIVWNGDASWLVESALCGDMEGDGTNELALLVWKRGSYGSARPAWVEYDEPVFSQHIFLFRWQDGALRPFWMSSALHPRVASWSMEPDGSLCITTKAGERTLWRWVTWGLERVDAPRTAY